MELGRDNVHKLRHRHQQTEGWQRQRIIQDRIYHGPLWYFHIETPTLMISKTCFVILSNIVERTPPPVPHHHPKQTTIKREQTTNKQANQINNRLLSFTEIFVHAQWTRFAGSTGERVSWVAGRAHSCISLVLTVMKTSHFTATRWRKRSLLCNHWSNKEFRRTSVF